MSIAHKLSKESVKVFNALTEGLEADFDNKEKYYRKIDNTNGSFMPVVIEVIDTPVQGGLVFSIAHYYEQNGDLMRDPEMTFWKKNEEEIFPMTYQMDGIFNGYRKSLELLEDGRYAINRRENYDQKVFANMWFRNIKEQQRLFPKKVKRQSRSSQHVRTLAY